MAIGMGESRERVRAMMLEVRHQIEAHDRSMTSNRHLTALAENDTARWQTARGAGLMEFLLSFSEVSYKIAKRHPL
jgi:hypothetical protein